MLLAMGIRLLRRNGDTCNSVAPLSAEQQTKIVDRTGSLLPPLLPRCIDNPRNSVAPVSSEQQTQSASSSCSPTTLRF